MALGNIIVTSSQNSHLRGLYLLAHGAKPEEKEPSFCRKISDSDQVAIFNATQAYDIHNERDAAKDYIQLAKRCVSVDIVPSLRDKCS